MNFPDLGIFAPRMRAKFEAYVEDKGGAAAVEFAMIAIPFFFFIFGLMEVCLLFIMSSVMEHGVQEASRQIRTGQIQTAEGGAVAFRNAVCSGMFDMLKCDERLHINVEQFDKFSSTKNTGRNDVIDEDEELDTSNFTYEPGGPNEIVVVSVFYEWDLITPVMSKPLVTHGGNRHLLQANMVFRNEPFGD